MFPYDYLIRADWQLIQQLEREAFLDPERSWMRLEPVRPGRGLLVNLVVPGIRHLVAFPGRVVRATPILLGRGHAHGRA